jgi:hypothetical protein
LAVEVLSAFKNELNRAGTGICQSAVYAINNIDSIGID